MGLLINDVDFVQYFNIPVNSQAETDDLLDTYIERYEKRYIYQLLGVTLGDLFIENLSEVSRDERFVVIEEEINLDDPDNPTSGYQYHSRGMVNMLTAFVFYEFVSSQQAFMTQSGIAVNINEAQTVLSPREAMRFAETKFNEALEDFETIQWYCNIHLPEDYPEYNGQVIKVRYSSLL